MEIGKRIISLRESRGWNQRELARRVDLNVSVMNRIELGERPVKDHELAMLSDVLEVNSDFLLGRTNNRSPVNVDDKDKIFFMSKIANEFPDINLMFKDMESLTAEDMEEVYDYIKFKKSQKKEGK